MIDLPRRGERVGGVTAGGKVFLSSMALLFWSCAAPPYFGFQLQDPPEGFLYDPDSSQDDVLFPGREIVVHGAWWRMSPLDEHATIAITHFRGPGTIEEVEAARDAFADAVVAPRGGDATQLQFLRIDDREAWGWEEHYHSQGELTAVAYRTVVLYDTAMVALEFHSDMDEWMDPSAQKEVLLSFALGETRILWGWVVVLLLLGALMVAGFFRRVSRSARQPMVSTDYELLTIEGGDGTQASASPGSGSDPGAPDLPQARPGPRGDMPPPT